MTTAAELVVGAAPAAWAAVGFDVAIDDTGVGHLQLGGIRLRVDPAQQGMTEWVLARGDDAVAGHTVIDIDGLRTSYGEPAAAPAADHPNTVFSIDHVVVNTPDLERTCAAIESATGAALKRVREAGPIRQGFHRLGELIVEVVTHAQVPEGPASFWGLAFNVRDIDALYERVGDELMSAPKTAVQPGRRIASFRIGAGLGLPIAVMTLREVPPPDL